MLPWGQKATLQRDRRMPAIHLKSDNTGFRNSVLDRFQKTLMRPAGRAPIGQKIEVPVLRLDQDEPHAVVAIDTR